MSISQPTPPLLSSPKKVPAVLRPGSKILLVGDAPGTEEVKQLIPFVGGAGKELDSQLADAGIRRSTVSLTNVFDERPPNNNLAEWAEAKKEIGKQIDSSRLFTYIEAERAKYVQPKYVQPALERLRDEIKKVNPNVVVALGNVAFSALCNTSGIGRARGSIHTSSLVPGLKVLPTYHPAAIFRQYDNRGTAIMDLMKAERESHSPDFNLRRRAIYLEPTISDLFSWRDRLLSASHLAMDIETKPAISQITCIGFAPSRDEAYVIPFWDKRKPDGSYWTEAEEIIAWKVVKEIVESPSTKIMQNGLYDVQYCAFYGWKVRGFTEDTMILHHSLYPSVPKGLDFLGSLYCNERAWKRLRPRGGEEKDDA